MIQANKYSNDNENHFTSFFLYSKYSTKILLLLLKYWQDLVASRGHTRTSRQTFFFFFLIKADLTLRCRNLRRERACRVLREYEMPDLGVQTISQTALWQPQNTAHVYIENG